jgi:hypothetical protein
MCRARCARRTPSRCQSNDWQPDEAGHDLRSEGHQTAPRQSRNGDRTSRSSEPGHPQLLSRWFHQTVRPGSPRPVHPRSRPTTCRTGQLRQLAQPTHLPNSKCIPGLTLDHPRLLAVRHALVRFAHIAGGDTFTARNLHPTAAAAIDSTPTSIDSASCVTICRNFEPSAR